MSSFKEVSNSNIEYPESEVSENKSRDTNIRPCEDSEYSMKEKWEIIMGKFGFPRETKIYTTTEIPKEIENKGRAQYFDKKEDDKYYDRDTGRSYDSIKEWKQEQEILAKRYENAAEFYKQKADKEYGRLKKTETNGIMSVETSGYLKTAQEYYHKCQENKEKADETRKKLEGVSIIESVDIEKNTDTRLPQNNGHWEGEEGNSKWIPDSDYVPPEKSRNPETSPYSNPDNDPWKEILEKYGVEEGIEYKDGYPVFDDVSKGTVEIDNFETGGSEAKNRNFKKADLEMAEQRGCTPQEVTQWRKDNNYTWHECENKKTMQKVPNPIHANMPHDGGRSRKE